MNSNLYKDFVRHNVGGLLTHVAVYTQGLFITPILIKSVGVELYGGYGLIAISLGFLFGISSFGVGYRSHRYLPGANTSQDRRDLFYPPFFFQLCSLGVLSLVILLLEPVLQSWLVKEKVEFNLLLAPLYLFCMMLFAQFTDFFRYTNRINIMNVAGVLFPYLGIGMMLAVVRYNLAWVTINNLVLIQVLAMGIVTLPLMVRAIREIGLALSRQSFDQYWTDFRLGLPLVLQNITDNILGVGDRYVLALFMSVIAVGYYNPAYGLGSLILFFPRAVGTALPQLLSRAVDNGQHVQAQRMLDYTISMFLLVGIPFVAGSAALSKPLLVLFANREVADNAYLVVPLVAAGSVFLGLTIILSNVLFVNKKTGALFRINLIAASVNLVLNVILISVFKNIVVAGVTTLLSYLIAFALFLRAVATDWPLDFRLRMLLKSALAAVVMAVGLFWTGSAFPARQFEPVFLLGEILVGALVYVAVALMSGAISKHELTALVRVGVSS